MENVTINYIRTFDNTDWQALYLPFDMAYEEWVDKVKVAEFYNVHQYDTDGDEEADKTTIEFFTLRGGTLKANTPYLVKPLATGPVTLTAENTTLHAVPDEEGFVDCMSTKAYYRICGIYQPKTDLYQTGQYAVAENGFRQALDETAVVPPFRIYMSVESRDGSSMRKARTIGISVDGEETTAVEGIAVREEAATECYDLQGRRMEKPGKGLYIVRSASGRSKGKKVLVK